MHYISKCLISQSICVISLLANIKHLEFKDNALPRLVIYVRYEKGLLQEGDDEMNRKGRKRTL